MSTGGGFEPERGVGDSPDDRAVDGGSIDGGDVVRATGGRLVRAVPDDGDLSLVEQRFRAPVEDGFAEAAGTWASLADHDGVVGLYDWESTGDVGRLVTERMDGGRLRALLDDDDTVVWPDQARWITERLCDAVVYAHERGVLHLAIDPSTVAFRETPSESWDRPKLGGWGVERYAREHPDGVADWAPGAVPPEQLAGDRFGDPDERTDVYQLGAVCYELLAGRPPRTGTGYETVAATLAGDDLVPPSDHSPVVPESLSEVVTTALATDPDDRYDDVAAFREALSACDLGPAVRSAPATGSFRQYAAGPANRGLVGDRTGEAALAEAWRTRLSGAVEAPPAVAHGTVYVGDDEGTVVALAAGTGAERWRTTPESYADEPGESWGGIDPHAITRAPAVGHGTVCVGSEAGVVGLSAADGGKRWEREIDVVGELTVDGDRLYVPERHDGRLYVLSITDGETVWEYETDAGFSHDDAVAAAVADDLVVVNTVAGLVALDAESGEARWEFPADGIRAPSVADGRVYAGDSDTLYAVDAADGTADWRATVGREIPGPPAVDDASVYATVLTDGGGVDTFDPDSGDLQWRYDVSEGGPDRLPASTALVGESAVLLLVDPILTSDDDAEELLVLGADDGRPRHRHALGVAEHAPPAVAADRIVLGDDEYDVTALDRPAVDPGSAPATGSVAVDRRDGDGADVDREGLDVDWADAERVCAFLADCRNQEFDKERLPGMLEWTEGRTRHVVSGLQAEGIVEVDDWDNVVLLVDDPGAIGPEESVAADDSGEDSPAADASDARDVDGAAAVEPVATDAEMRVPDGEAARSPERRSLSPGEMTVGERLGGGGQAVVHEACLPEGSPERVALREPLGRGTRPESVVERFLDQADTWATIDRHERTRQRWAESDHVVGVVDTGDGQPWIATEYMDGGDLAERIADHPDGLPVAEALWLGECVCQGLEVAHQLGHAHLDVTPSNVLLRETDGWPWPKLADWGLARTLADETGTMDGLTVAYAAPEQFDAAAFGDPDQLTDVYQTGALVYALLTGGPPATGSPLDVMGTVLAAEPVAPPSQRRPGLPAAVDAAVGLAMAREKTDRYDSISTFGAALRAIRTGGRLPRAVAARLAE